MTSPFLVDSRFLTVSRRRMSMKRYGVGLARVDSGRVSGVWANCSRGCVWLRLRRWER